MNSTNFPNNVRLCLIEEIKSTDPFKIVINIFRFGILFLYILWLFITIWVKELRSRQMIFMINISACSVYSSAFGLALIFYITCSSERPTQLSCFMINFSNIFATYYTGYALCALALNRLVCSYGVQIKTWLKWKFILPIVAFTWIFPHLLALIQMFAFNSIYFNNYLSICSDEVLTNLGSFIFYIIFAILLPNILVIVSYIMFLYKVREAKRKSSATSKKLESPRITVQLIIYIAFFEIGSVARLLMQFQRTSLVFKVSGTVSMVLQIARWFHYLSPLGLLYLHPELLEKYKKMICCIKKSVVKVQTI